DLSLADFEPQQSLEEDASRTVISAIRRTDSLQVRLTTFSNEFSSNESFRRALRLDRELLANLSHSVIPRLVGFGETNGQLFFCTEWADGVPLSDLPAEFTRRLTVDDVIDIGWQLCSALQQAHNLGATHGGISDDCVLLTPGRRVALLDFGVRRWIQAGTRPAAESTGAVGLQTEWRDEIRADLISVGRILSSLLTQIAVVPGSEQERTSTALKELLQRPGTAGSARTPESARDFQGQLGELLLGDHDSIPLVDQRNPSVTSRRSIVEELFDEPDDPNQQKPVDVQPKRRRRTQFLPVFLLVILGLLLLVLAASQF
ncbi:MAG: protein kinase, partial [Planctomycetaceae bacterium]|nr:protein kinase [Planctomycetaceae bacterium]